jgi:hypothetical protein
LLISASTRETVFRTSDLHSLHRPPLVMLTFAGRSHACPLSAFALAGALGLR